MSRHENGQLSIDFVVVFVGGLPNQPDRFGPIDVAYRVESTDGAFLDATEANRKAGLIILLVPFYAISSPRRASAPGRCRSRANMPTVCSMPARDFCLQWAAFGQWRSVLGDLITLSDAEWRIEGAELVGTQRLFPYPGRYEERSPSIIQMDGRPHHRSSGSLFGATVMETESKTYAIRFR